MGGDPDELGKGRPLLFCCSAYFVRRKRKPSEDKYDPPATRIGGDQRIMYVANASGELRDVLMTCKICANGSMTPLFFGGRPGDRPQYRDIKAQCDKCGSILSAVPPASQPDDVAVQSNDLGSW